MKLLLIPQIYGFFTVILNTVHPPLGCVLFPNPTCSRTDDSVFLIRIDAQDLSIYESIAAREPGTRTAKSSAFEP